MRLLMTLCACCFLGTSAVAAKDGDIDEYATRLQIRKHNKGISQEEETRIFLLHKLLPQLFKYDKNFDGKIQSDELSAAVAAVDDDVTLALDDYTRGVHKIPGPPDNKNQKSKPTAGEPEKKAVFLLRRKFDQISALAFPESSDKDATGAVFSYGRDNASSNTVWAAQGVAAIIFGQNYPTLTESQRFGTIATYAGGPFVQFDKLSNSSSAKSKSNLDNLTLGVIGEVGIESTLREMSVTNYLRVKGGVTTDFEGATKNWNIAGEWQPVSNMFGLNSPLRHFHPFYTSVVPIFKAEAEFASMLGDATQPIFAHHDQALRVGPTVGLQISPIPQGNHWPKALENMTLKVTYSLLQDLMSPATYNLFETDFTYYADDNKTVGITLNYSRGQVRETGATNDTFMAGLSLKLYQELRSTAN